MSKCHGVFSVRCVIRDLDGLVEREVGLLPGPWYMAPRRGTDRLLPDAQCRDPEGWAWSATWPAASGKPVTESANFGLDRLRPACGEGAS